MLLSNTLYDRLKKSVTVVLPGLAALYFALAQIWELPKAEEVVGTMAAVTTFLGLLLGAASKSFNNSDAKFDGTLALENREDGTIIRLQQVDENALLDKDEVVLRVNR